MPMFDIKDSEDIELTRNKSKKGQMAKVERVKGFKAKDNEAYSNDNHDEIIELKPNFFGIGINLRALTRKLKKIFHL
uniref:hypothetical protein n=1 Tax=Halomonas sp. TaxID=1486246 RepID=UPI002613DF80|nr:hypothetical protein [Halomonas sp.]